MMHYFVQKIAVLCDFALGHYSSISKSKSILSAHIINGSQLSS